MYNFGDNVVNYSVAPDFRLLCCLFVPMFVELPRIKSCFQMCGITRAAIVADMGRAPLLMSYTGVSDGVVFILIVIGGTYQ